MDNKPVLDIDIDISIHLSYFIDGGEACLENFTSQWNGTTCLRFLVHGYDDSTAPSFP